MLRKEKVVGKFVEFYGEGTGTLSVPDRATIGNMAPEYGATMGFFPVDTATVDYLRATGRTDAQVDAFETYFKAQGLFGMPVSGQIDYTKTLSLDLSTITPSLAGPKRPQDRIELPKLASRFAELFSKTGSDGFSQTPDKLRQRYKTMPMVAGRGLGAISDAQRQPPHPGAARLRRDGEQPSDARPRRARRHRSRSASVTATC
jgi:aconitate hydratase